MLAYSYTNQQNAKQCLYLKCYIAQYAKVYTFHDAAEATEAVPSPPSVPEFPEHATYILVGAGTAAFAAYRAIRKGDPGAKVRFEYRDSK